MPAPVVWTNGGDGVVCCSIRHQPFRVVNALCAVQINRSHGVPFEWERCSQPRRFRRSKDLASGQAFTRRCPCVRMRTSWTHPLIVNLIKFHFSGNSVVFWMILIFSMNKTPQDYDFQQKATANRNVIITACICNLQFAKNGRSATKRNRNASFRKRE